MSKNILTDKELLDILSKIRESDKDSFISEERGHMSILSFEKIKKNLKPTKYDFIYSYNYPNSDKIIYIIYFNEFSSYLLEKPYFSSSIESAKILKDEIMKEVTFH